ncbi:DNA mismatch repair protein Msh2 isoform X1 [Diorhabda sublineata]|uniref:DNA mismatch repair protein Msh2 isoform X1 n=1 Tax=Diorhabda sublineata TaxID=1163346 RepID=UPI0024E05AAB|nr:DNA mismatch repair protein Msh2 isoform X1 [Diorhabda sublineata]
MNSHPQKALNLDLVQQLDFIRYYRGLPEKPSSTIRFFNRNEYYSLHGEDTDLAAEFLSTPVKYMGDEPKLSYVTVSKGQFELFLRELLIVRQYRVEVYIKQSTKGNQWALEYKGSPGNLSQFEDLLFENVPIDFTNCVMSIKICPNKLLALSCVNVTECKFEVCEITDNDSFSELEGLIAQIGPKECILPNGETPDLVALRKVLERNGILIAKVKASDFAGDLAQDLNRLLYFSKDQQRNCFSYKETNFKNALGCLSALIKFLNLNEDEKNFNQFKLSTLDARRFVRIDNAALFALHVIPKASNTGPNNYFKRVDKSSSLKGLLDNCATAQGSRLLEQWIKQPLKDIHAINERLEVVECISMNLDIRTQLVKEWLPRVMDLVPLSRKIGSKNATLQDCYKVYTAVSTIPAIIKVLRELNNKFVNDMLVDPLSELSSDMQNFQNMIEQTLDFELVDRAEFLIKSSFDESLTELAQQKDEIQEKMQKVLSRVANDLDLDKNKGVKLEYTEQLGYFFRVTLKDEKSLRKHKDFKILGAIKGGVRFTNSKLSDLSESYSVVNEEYKERQKNVVKELIEVASEYADTLKNLNILVAKVDVLTSFAIAAISARIPYMKPKLLPGGSGILKLNKVRHPCIEAQENISFIPNDVSFEKDGKKMFIITGPNMCGKSTYIRSIGTAVLMAHIGSLVPCSAAEISVVDAILVRVGAEDCQLKGLSTFMLEMIETSTIIKTATCDSLVIIDELGRGTSTYDGCGLAWAIAEYIANVIKPFSLFATHFHELNLLAEKTEFVGNLHVSALVTDDEMTPLYTIREGECDKSYGIHCARLVKFPDDVIQDAIKYQKKLEHQSGLKYIKDFEPSVKRKIISEGDEIIKNTLKKFKSLDLDTMTDDELQNYIQKAKEELVTTNNLFINGLLDL